MKKRLAVLLLVVAVVLSFWAPAALAQVSYSLSSGAMMDITGGGGSGSPVVPPTGALTSAQAIAAVTKYFKPPDGAIVNSNYSASFLPIKRETWNINWMVPASPLSGESGGSMWASVDALTGRILNFSRMTSGGAAAPGTSGAVYSSQHALATARQTMAELAPEAVGHVKLETTPNSYGISSNFDYQFDFVRLANGLPVWSYGQSQGVDIAVNARTGEVDNYEFDWLTDVGFPSQSPSLSVTQATYDWWKAGGLELHYIMQFPATPMTQDTTKVRLAYIPASGGLFVDAGSGRVVDNLGQPVPAAVAQSVPAATVALRTPPPGGLPTGTAAVAWAQQVLPVPAGYKIADVSQGQVGGPAGLTKPRTMWNLAWSNGQVPGSGIVSAAFYADTGQLMSFNAFPQPLNLAQPATSSKPALSSQQALQKAVDFLAGTAGINPAEGYRLETQASPEIPSQDQTGYSFNFTATPNGIPSDTGGLNITVSSSTGQVVNFINMADQLTVNLPSPKGIISLDQARDIFNQHITLQLGYLIPGGPSSSYPLMTGSTPQTAVLVYGVPVRFAAAVIDARTGEVTDRQGDNLLAGPPADVAGSWAANNIELVLQRHLMTVDAQGLFHPGSPVTRGQAVEMLLGAVGGYGGQYASSGPVDFQDVPAGSAYYGPLESAYHMGLVTKADRFYPGRPVTREDFAVMVVRALRYDAVGKMALRIPLPYTDAGQVSPGEANYVALAAGLGIFHSGGDFRPLDPLTRAEAATVLVNLPSPR